MRAVEDAWLAGFAIDHSGAVETAEDFELPEYRPEVRRVVGVQCSVTRDNAFLDGDEAEISGSVLYTVLYLSGEGALSSVPLFSTWSTRIPLPAGEGLGIDDLHCTCAGENVLCRVTGPRKVTLSAKVRVRCTALGKVDCSTQFADDPSAAASGKEAAGMHAPAWLLSSSPAVSMKTCRYTGNITGVLHPDFASPGVSAAESLSPERQSVPKNETKETALPTATPQVITCQGAVCIHNVQRTPEGLQITGEAVIQMLVLSPAGTYTVCRSRSPLEDTLPCPNLGKATAADVSACGKCASLTVQTEETGEIHWEMEYDLEGTVLCSHQTVRAVDGYSRKWEDSPVFDRTDAVIGGHCIRGQVTVNGEKPLRHTETADGKEGELRFLFGWGRGVWEKAEQLPDGRTVLSGTAVCTVLLSGRGDITAEEVVLPVRYEWSDTEKQHTDVEDCRCSFTVWDVGGRLDGSILHLHAEVGCEGILFHRQSCLWLRELKEHTDRPLVRTAPAVVICYPTPEETLWDIQKRYRTEAVEEQEGRYILKMVSGPKTS